VAGSGGNPLGVGPSCQPPGDPRNLQGGACGWVGTGYKPGDHLPGRPIRPPTKVKSPRPLKPYQTDRFFDNLTRIVGGLPRLHPCSILALQRLVREFTALQGILPSVGGRSVGPQGHVVPQGTGSVREPSPAAAAPLTPCQCPWLVAMRLSSRPVPPARLGRAKAPAVTCAPHRRSPWDRLDRQPRREEGTSTPPGKADVLPTQPTGPIWPG